MSDTAPAAQEAAPGPIDYQPPATSQEAISLDDAVRLWNEPSKEKEEAESAEPATAEASQERASKSEAKAEDANQETDPGETEPQAAEPAEELPPIEPPRSWTKEEKELFAKWPREAQESISRVASTREADFRRSQNEAAEARKALDAKLAEAEQVRKEYESKLPTLVKTLEDTLQAEFGDIQTMQDVRKLQAEDPFRFQQWQIKQMELADAVQKKTDADRRGAQEKQSKWASYTQDQDKKFSDSLSDADKAKIKDLMNDAPAFLQERGFSDEELAGLWNGNELFRDHRTQSLILDAMKYRDLQKAPPKAVPKTVPPVQRPGSAQPKSTQTQSIQALNKRLSDTGSVDDALALLYAQRQAS